MTQSIEEIWKEGFTGGDDLSAPKVEALYDAKSKNLVDKFDRMYDLNLKGILVAIIALPIIGMLLGHPYIAIFVAGLMTFVWVKGRSAHIGLKSIDKHRNSYEYLKSFSDWQDEMMLTFAGVYRIFYPVLALGLLIKGVTTDIGQEAIAGYLYANPDASVVMGLPLVLILAIAGITIFFGLISGPLYRLDVKSLYGRQMDRLRETLADMEAMRAQENQ